MYPHTTCIAQAQSAWTKTNQDTGRYRSYCLLWRKTLSMMSLIGCLRTSAMAKYGVRKQWVSTTVDRTQTSSRSELVPVVNRTTHMTCYHYQCDNTCSCVLACRCYTWGRKSCRKHWTTQLERTHMLRAWGTSPNPMRKWTHGAVNVNETINAYDVLSNWHVV